MFILKGKIKNFDILPSFHPICIKTIFKFNMVCVYFQFLYCFWGLFFVSLKADETTFSMSA